MPRKNNKAGQPNRLAQKDRRALHVVTRSNFKRVGVVFTPAQEVSVKK